MFEKKGIKNVLPSDSRSQVEYFTNRRAGFSFLPGEIEGFVDVSKKETERQKKKNELATLNVDFHQDNKATLLAERALCEREIKKLQKEIDDITGNNEKEVRVQAVRYSQRLIDDANINPKRKRVWQYFETYKNLINKLNEIVRNRLKNESQNKDKLKEDSDAYKNF